MSEIRLENNCENNGANRSISAGEYRKSAEEMLGFVAESPSCFHAIANLKEMLTKAGYRELAESSGWQVVPGGKYYVIRNDSSVIAVNIPAAQIADGQADAKQIGAERAFPAVKGFHMIASHSDSPTFKVKESPEMLVEEKYVKLNTEKYGGMILSTWMDRALSVAGRVAMKEGNNIVTKLVNINEDLLVIPNLAIHMNREMNKGVEYNPQVDMLPLFADCAEEGGKEAVKGALMRKLAQYAGVEAEDILGHDLFLYTREKGKVIGANGEFVFSPRLDDLQCAYTSMKAFVESEPENYINICAVFDNEEVGSGTGQGADSTFLEDTLWRVAEGLGADKSTYLQWVAGSFLISADNAHAVHPNRPEKADPTNRPYLNGGIVIKYHGSQKYTTDAVSAAKMKCICKVAEVPFQTFTNRSDALGGSTLGNISTAHVSVSSVDIGLPQLAMHSAVETAGVKDTEYAVKAFKVFFSE